MPSALPLLHSYFRSSCSYRVRIALAHKGVKYTLRPVNLLRSDHCSPAFLEKSPLGLVPVLQIDGHTLSQSIAILEYLEETRRHSPLLPEASAARARVRELCQVIAADTQPIQNLSVMAHAAALAGHSEAKAAWARHYIKRGFKAVEAMLAESAGTFSVGDHFSLADVCLAPQAYNALRFDVDLRNEFPCIADVYSRILQQEAVLAAHPHAQPDCPDELAGQIV